MPTDPYVTGSMTMDLGTGTGSATLQPSMTFTGFWWTVHSIDLTSTGPGTLHADMLIDWGFTASQLYQSTTEFGMIPTAPCSCMDCYTVGNTFYVNHAGWLWTLLLHPGTNLHWP